jgi:hypothetical protein
MFPAMVRLAVHERALTSGACELCGTDPAPLAAVVAVQHERGGAMQFIACDRCTRALHRVAAALGGEGQLTEISSTVVDAATPMVGSVPRPRVLQAEVLAEISDHLVDTDGSHYVIRVCGGPRQDGMWVGWLEFVAIGEQRVRRTGQETTQSSREDLAYWAAGLEPIYLQGAFARAQ